jgi:hypothetical protein
LLTCTPASANAAPGESDEAFARRLQSAEAGAGASQSRPAVGAAPSAAARPPMAGYPCASAPAPQAGPQYLGQPGYAYTNQPVPAYAHNTVFVTVPVDGAGQVRWGGGYARKSCGPKAVVHPAVLPALLLGLRMRPPPPTPTPDICTHMSSVAPTPPPPQFPCASRP